MIKRSRITDVQNPGSAPPEILDTYYMAILLGANRKHYLLYAAELRRNTYELKLVRVGVSDKTKLPIFIKECYTTTFYASSPMYAEDAIHQALIGLTESNMEDPFNLTLSMGGIADNTPLTHPTRSK